MCGFGENHCQTYQMTLSVRSTAPALFPSLHTPDLVHSAGISSPACWGLITVKDEKLMS